MKLHQRSFRHYITAETIQARVAELGAQIGADYQGRRPLWLGVLNGAFVFAADLARACPADGDWQFVTLASYHGMTTTGKVETVLGLRIDIADRDVIIVEDIVDTGTTLHHFMDELRSKKPASLALAAIFVKRDAMKYPIQIDYVGFEIPSAFVVGYGLDYDGLGRGLRDLYQLDE